MKKAVISTGSRQYLVSEGDIIEVNKLDSEKTVDFVPLMIIDGEKIQVGKPNVTGKIVKAEIIEKELLGPKVTAIRYKAKKRVKKVRGHRQLLTKLKITSIK